MSLFFTEVADEVTATVLDSENFCAPQIECALWYDVFAYMCMFGAFPLAYALYLKT